MKARSLALALLLASPVAAEAGCSKASLNGNWVMLVSNSGPSLGMKVNMSNGKFVATAGGSTLITVKITSLGSNCKGVGTLTQTVISSPPFSLTLPASIKAEIPAGNGKPNNLVVVASLGPITLILSLNRHA